MTATDISTNTTELQRMNKTINRKLTNYGYVTVV